MLFNECNQVFFWKCLNKVWIANVRGGNVICHIEHDIAQPIKVNERNREGIGINEEGDNMISNLFEIN